ncbi:hypothetical protein CF326_g5554 [Tilletia indica]|nr:hypothetical protein CF326_g5554 [Tilletia indica]
MDRRPLADKGNVPVEQQRYIELDSPGPSPKRNTNTLGRDEPSTPTASTPRRSKSNLLPNAYAHAIAASTLTPKKRAVPQDENHARNVVLAAGQVSPSPKRARVGVRTPNSTSIGAAASGSTSKSVTLPPHSISSHEKLARTALVNKPSPGRRIPATQLLRPTPGAGPSASTFLQPAPRTKSAPKPTSVVTTTRIDKSSRISEHERQARLTQQQEEANVWRAKFRKAFPSFVFYLDSYDPAMLTQVAAAVESLGARVEPFFSKQVTHLVTTRSVPTLPVAPAEVEMHRKNALVSKTMPDKSSRNAVGAMVASAKVDKKPWSGLPQSIEAARRAKIESNASASTSTLDRRHASGSKPLPIHSDRNPFDEPGPPPSANDIVYKAKGFGMKVWHHSKLTTILNMLLGDQSTTVNQAAKEDLGALLAREKIEGTTERDPNAPRADFYYFPTKVVHYLLVEDATGEHRPIMIQEYEKPRDRQAAERPAWPKLYGELEGRCPFTYYDVSRHGNRTEKKPTANKTLRRALSLNQLGAPATASHELDRSAMTTNGNPYGDVGRSFLNEGMSLGGHCQESGTVAPYQLASGNSVNITSNIASTAQGSTTSFGPGTSGAGPGIMPLRHLPAGMGGIRRSVSVNEGLRARARAEVAAAAAAAARQKEKEKKPGYCENCRLKFDDIEEHMRTKKHQRFANNPDNFAEIDELILRCQ